LIYGKAVNRPRVRPADASRTGEAGVVGEDHGLDPVAKPELHEDALPNGEIGARLVALTYLLLAPAFRSRHG
jgi:hypothetical protein